MPGRRAAGAPASGCELGMGRWIAGSRAARDDGDGRVRLVPEPMPALPRSMPGLSSFASAGSVGGSSGRLALARVGRAGSFLLCLAGSRGGRGDFIVGILVAYGGGGRGRECILTD